MRSSTYVRAFFKGLIPYITDSSPFPLRAPFFAGDGIRGAFCSTNSHNSVNKVCYTDYLEKMFINDSHDKVFVAALRVLTAWGRGKPPLPADEKALRNHAGDYTSPVDELACELIEGRQGLSRSAQNSTDARVQG